MNNIRQKLIDQINIVDEIGSNIELQAKGRNHVGLCPFHADNNPSFTVSDEKKIYKCFVCGEGGDVVKFHSKFNHISTNAAIEQLANKYNINIPKFQKQVRIDSTDGLLNDVNKFYVTALHSTKQGEEALGYLKTRGFDNDTIKHFHLGYGYDVNNGLYKYIEKKISSERKYTFDDLVAINQFQNERDLFARRVTIPIFVNNKIVGFGGRALDDNTVKYLNSKDSKKFSKKETLYHFDDAIKLSPDNSIVVVEGFFDVIKAYQNNIKNAVALMGTAFSNNHLTKLRKSNIKTIYLGLDSDNAGIEAAIKVGEKFIKNNFKVKLLNYGSYKDLDEFLTDASNNHDDFVRLQTNGVSFKQFQSNYLLENVNLQSSDEKDSVINQITTNLNQENDIVVEEIINKLENTLSVSREFIYNKIEQNKVEVTQNSSTPQQDNSDYGYDNYYFEGGDDFDNQAYEQYASNTSQIMTEPAASKKIVVDSSIMFMNKVQLVVFRALNGKNNYLKLRSIKTQFNKDLGIYNTIFDDIGQYYDKYSVFDFVTFTDIYPQYADVITDLYNKKIVDSETSDEELIKSLATKSSWGLFSK